MKKRVVIITPTLMTGGAETMVVRLASNIDSAKYDVMVACLSKRMDTALERELGKANVKIKFFEKNKSRNLSTIISTWKFLSKMKPDVIHSHISGTIYATPWALVHNCKIIHTVHTKPDMEFSEKFRKVLGLMVNRGKAIIVAVSKENQKIAMDYYHFGPDRIRYVNNPVDVSKYYSAIKNDNRLTFINVSRQDENKNQKMAINAFKEIANRLPNSELVLVGNGNQHDSLINMADIYELTDRIHFPGEVTNVEDYLAKADIYVSTSHREGLPLSMLEAMASKLPIISTDVGGISDIIDGNGILVQDDDYKSMSEAMLQLASDVETRKKYSNRSYEIVKDFDVAICAKKYEMLYEQFSKKEYK